MTRKTITQPGPDGARTSPRGVCRCGHPRTHHLRTGWCEVCLDDCAPLGTQPGPEEAEIASDPLGPTRAEEIRRLAVNLRLADQREAFLRGYREGRDDQEAGIWDDNPRTPYEPIPGTR